MIDKPHLRARMRARRRAHADGLPRPARVLAFLRPPERIAALVPEGGIVGLYHAAAAEAPTAGYARWFFEHGRHLALPWFAGRDAPMQFRAWADPRDEDLLVAGPYGALQPRADAPPLDPVLAFVPLVAFTAAGARLGQGGGHYDRWQAAHPLVPAIGLAWDVQLVDDLPMEAHDRPLHAVITPTRLYEA